jgi:hypothetical protein
MRDKWKPVTEEDLQRIVDKWKHVLEPRDESLSAYRATAILIESQEKWHTKEEVDAATPKKNL